MNTLWRRISSQVKQNAFKIVLFGYALALGTALPLTLSRCGSNCLSCGSCSISLGIIPVIAAVALRSKIKSGWTRLFRGGHR